MSSLKRVCNQIVNIALRMKNVQNLRNGSCQTVKLTKRNLPIFKQALVKMAEFKVPSLPMAAPPPPAPVKKTEEKVKE